MKTENEILEIAFLLFLEKGFSEVSTNELIRAAGLTKGGFYYSFKSRDDLDQQVVEKYIRPFFSRPTEEMQQVWEKSRAETPTAELLWKGFFLPQRFANYQKKIGKKIAFRNFYFLLYEGMKKFPEVEEYFKEFNKKKSRLLYEILERGQKRGEILKSIDLENYVTMILAMQDGILALRVLDETTDEEEKYTKIQYQMWKEISTAKMQNYEDGGVTSAVS